MVVGAADERDGDFTLSVRRFPTGNVVVCVESELLAEASQRAIAELGRSPARLALDLSQVTLVGSVGPDAVLSAAETTGESDMSFCLMACRAVVCDSLDRGGARLCPSGLATTTPQIFTVASLGAGFTGPGSSPNPYELDDAPLPTHIPVRFEPVKRCEALRHRFFAYSSRSCKPDPHHLTVLTRPGPCRGCSHPLRHLLDQAAPASAGALRRPDGKGLSPPLKSQPRTAHEA